MAMMGVDKPGPHLWEIDPYLAPFRTALEARVARCRDTARRLCQSDAPDLGSFASGHTYYGLHRTDAGWLFREWAPNADAIWMIGPFSDWTCRDGWRLERVSAGGDWELRLPAEALEHGDLYKLMLHWPGGGGERVPAYARRMVQDPATHVFCAQLWAPAEPYRWRHPVPPRPSRQLIYEAHVGMAQEEPRVGTYEEFRRTMLPRIAEAGYNTIQLMAVMEHPYYGSFGYHVSGYFAASSRFGTPDELKALIDEAHGVGLRVIIDLVHSHAVRNENEGLSCFDGTPYQYFHDGSRGWHQAWDSRCFDYGKPGVLHFLLSNCRFWLDEYRVDGYRVDGVTSMLYHDHGFGSGFNTYDDYFGPNTDPDAVTYLALANTLIHTLRPDALTVAEDVSGMPGLCAPPDAGGCGFDCRLAMGIPDFWFRLVETVRDEDWDLDALWHALTDKRAEERTVSYVESHDQAIVGSKTLIFHLADAEMYTRMRRADESLAIDRAMALHKLIRLVTCLTGDAGYLSFMGNEFGHPEWIDFPRAGNGWSYQYARRQWRLRDDPDLRYGQLADFDAAMLRLTQAWTGDRPPGLLHCDHAAKVLGFARHGDFAFFNFHPTESVVDYPVEVLPGDYTLALDSDAPAFGGQGRVTPGQVCRAEPTRVGREQRYVLRLYLPARTALVLRRRSVA